MCKMLFLLSWFGRVIRIRNECSKLEAPSCKYRTVDYHMHPSLSLDAAKHLKGFPGHMYICLLWCFSSQGSWCCCLALEVCVLPSYALGLLFDRYVHSLLDGSLQTVSPSVVHLLDKSAASIVSNNGQLRMRFLAGQYLRANWLFSALSDEVLRKCAQMFDIRAWRSSEQVIKV